MPELAQWMIDGGATFFDAAGNPTRPDGTPVIDQTPVVNLGMGDPVPSVSSGDPQFLGLGPPYRESPQDYFGPPPLDPGIWNDMNMEAYSPGQLRYEGGVGMPVNWQDYKGNTSTGGGFFTLDQVYAKGGIPESFQSGSWLPSTNNWRLLPGGQPGYIMRNGRIINTNDAQGMYGPYGMGEFGGRYSNPQWRGGSALGVPAAHAFGSIAGTVFGWPGQLDQIGYIPPAT